MASASASRVLAIWVNGLAIVSAAGVLLVGLGWLPQMLPPQWVGLGLGLFFGIWAIAAMSLYLLKVRPKLQLLQNIESQAKGQRETHKKDFVQSPAALLILDKAGGFLEVNLAACSLLGLPKGWVEGSLLDFIYESDRSTFETALHALVGGEREYKSLELRLIDPKGRLTWSVVTLRVGRDAQGRMESIRAAVFDTHKMKSQVQRVEQQYRETRDGLDALTQFILARGQFIAKTCDRAMQVLNPNEVNDAQSNIHRQAEFQALAYEGRALGLGAQYQLGSLSSTQAEFDLHVELRPLLARWQRAADRKHLHWVLDYRDPGRWTEYRGDGQGILCLIHLLMDTVVNNTDSGEIVVRVIINPGEDQDRLGIVIQANTLSPLGQSEDDVGEQFLLGLIHQWVDCIGGRLQLDYDKEKGSWLSLSVALEKAATAPVRDDCPIIEDTEDQSQIILVVEDTPINQMIAEEALGNAGFDVILAANGQEALSVLQQEKNITLILMDIQMPVMDGIHCTQEIRKLPEYQEIPIIALTANRDQDTRQACLQAGMDDFLVKPIHPERLGQIINQVLGGRMASGRTIKPKLNRSQGAG